MQTLHSSSILPARYAATSAAYSSGTDTPSVSVNPN